jgi:hypothetical protein
MSQQPTVCAVMLTRNRPEMAKHAVRCWQAQAYENKRLLIWDTSDELEACNQMPAPGIMRVPAVPETSIGELRNAANFFASIGNPKPEIFIHWDDDEHSSPHRIAEQVALLQASGADAVGYSDMLFWREADQQAWLYLGPQKALGTSLAYWRSTWEKKPFPDQPRPGFATGEDTDWIRELTLASNTSIVESEQDRIGVLTPRMVARIHSKNTSGSYQLMEHSDSWRRVSEWDNYCREVFA